MKSISLNIALKLLSKIYKIDNILYIGIGSGEEIDLLKQLDTNEVILVDANINQIERINKWIDLPNSFSLDNTCIYNDNEVKFHITSFSYVSGVANPKSYDFLFPNIEIVDTLLLKSISLDAYIKAKNIKPNYLFIDTLDLVEILNYGNDTLKIVDVLICTIEKNKKDNLIEELKEFDLKIFSLFEENNPEILKVIFVKDYKSILKENNDNLQKKELNFENEKEIFNRKIRELEIKNENLKKIYEKILEQKEKLYQEEIINFNKEIKLLKENNKRYKIEFNETLNSMTLTLKKDILRDIKSKATNVVKQLESYLNINNFLTFNTMPLNFHGWPISSDLGEFLLNKILTRDYDIVLEFGSGTSTLLFAQIIQKLNINRDIPIKQIAFEHHEKYYQQTRDYLKALKLEHNVELNLVSLVSLIHKGTEYKYYDCNNKFKEIKRLDINKFLVLVDGPQVIPVNMQGFQLSYI